MLNNIREKDLQRKPMTNSRDELKAHYPDIAKALKQLVLLKKDAKVKTESVKDTFQDLSIYGIIAQIVSNGNWK